MAEQEHEILVGNDIHKSEFITKFNILGKDHLFHVVPDSFPIPEDGIIGQPFISKYKHAITNTHLILGNKGIPLHTNVTLAPGECRIGEAMIENNPAIVCFINSGEHKIQDDIIEIESPNLTDKIEMLKTKIRLDHVELRLRKPLEKIILSYGSAFSFDTDPLPCTNLTSHQIDVKTTKPINVKSYRPPECHRNEIEKQINEMLDRRIIESSDSPYNAPVWVVPKKLDASGKRKWRIVIDFRKLNEITDQDAYPLPVIDTILSQLGNAKFFQP